MSNMPSSLSVPEIIRAANYKFTPGVIPCSNSVIPRLHDLEYRDFYRRGVGGSIAQITISGLNSIVFGDIMVRSLDGAVLFRDGSGAPDSNYRLVQVPREVRDAIVHTLQETRNPYHKKCYELLYDHQAKTNS